MQEDAPSVTAETSTSDTPTGTATSIASGIARRFTMVAVGFFVVGLTVTAVATLQGTLPELLSGTAETSYGRLVPAGRTLLLNGWIIVGLLGASIYALSNSTGSDTKRPALANASLLLLVVGTLSGAVAIVLGLQSGVAGMEAPLWARAITVAGFVLATVAISSTARSASERLGATGWYLTAGAWWLAASGVVGLFPTMDGIGGSIQSAFVSASITGLFVIVTSVGLLYFLTTSLTGTDPATPRPLGALGFWSLAVVWGSMSATGLMFSAAPDWYESLGVGIAIGAFVPLLAIATDLGLMLKGTVGDIADRATLRYATVAFVSLGALTVTNLLLTYRSTSAVVEFTTFALGNELLVIFGVGSFALFAAHSAMTGGNESGSSFHFSWSVAGLVGAGVGAIVGGLVVGFSWAAGPASASYANAGEAWKITAVSAEPFLLITAVSMIMFGVAQIAYLLSSGSRHRGETLDTPDGAIDYDLEFEGEAAFPSWRRLVWGASFVWLAALLFTGVFPAIDPANEASTILGDNSRTYPAGSAELIGRDLYISEGCVECHTQSVRPVGTDVGLGPVGNAGDYRHETSPLLGNHRFGPDLMHVASSEIFDASRLGAHLEDPRVLRPWSTMPSYSYLSASDIDALTSYIRTLR